MKKFLLTAIFAFIGALAFAQERIAVFPFEDMDNVFRGNESFMFYFEFSNAFTNKMPDRAVVPRLDVDRLISTEFNFQLSVFSAQEKTAEMNQVLNGTQILSGYIARVGNGIRITVSLFTYPELRQLPGGTSGSVANTTELFNIIPELVQEMRDIIDGGGTVQSLPEGLMYQIVGGRTVTIIKYTGNTVTLNIPSHIEGLPVTTIMYNAFSDCESLTSVTIPSSVTYMGENTVTNDGCNLTSFNVDNRNTVYASVDGVLFDKNLRTLIKYPRGRNQRTYIIPSSVTSIRSGAFLGCSSLASVTIPPSVASIDGSAFSGCSSLTSVTIPPSVTSIRWGAFSGCSSLTSIIIPSSITSIENSTFGRCSSLTSITIPSSVTSIGDTAFLGCSSLTNITIPSSVTSIGDRAFEDCISLTSITIPSSVTSIGNMAFSDCRSLRSITIPSSVTSIGTSMFIRCSSLTNITIPSSVTSIGSSAFYFSGLTSVTIPSSVTTIGDWAFACCYNLTSVTIPSSVTYIGDSAFGSCISLTSVTIPSSVMTIRDGAFYGCNSLTSVTLSRRTQVGENAFPRSARITYRD